MPAATSLARAWFGDLRGGEFFFASEVPGRSDVVRPLLSRLAADDTSPVHREMQGFYCKLWHEDDDFRPPFSDHVRGALKLAGPGGGGARLFALNRVGWSLQLPSRFDFAALGRPPTSPWPRFGFGRRSNSRRSELSAGEVTLLEATRFFGQMESCPWSDAVRSIESGEVHERLGPPRPTLRADAIRWAAQAELNQPRVFHERIREACDALARSAR